MIMTHIHIMQKIYTNKSRLLLLLFTSFLLNACVVNKKTTYLQEYPESEYSTHYVPPVDYRLQPNDNLYVKVNTPDPTLAALFNIIPQTGAMTTNEQSTQLMSYSIDLEGMVDLPYIGKLEVAGRTLNEAKEMIVNELKDYVTDASVTVRLVNNYVTVLGEVRAPGTYLIYKDRLNIFQAIALAGDITEFGDRYTIKIVRQTMEGSIVKEFDMTDKNLIDSEFYYVVPNDVIYAQPMKGKFFAMNTFPFALVLTTISTFILLHSYITNP